MKQLIPLQYLNESCFLSLNSDEKEYKMVLKMAQEDLKAILGIEFYEEIENEYPSSLSTDNTSLYENYIKDFLAWQTYFYYLKFTNVKSTPTGVRVFNDENSDLASNIQMFSLEKNVRERALNYKGSIISFLSLERQKDSTKYPLWIGQCNQYGNSFAFTSVGKNPTTIINVNKSISTNE